MKTYGIDNVSHLAKELGYKAPEKLNRLKKPGKSPSVDIITDILKTWPDVNPSWLLLGIGNLRQGGRPENKGPSNKIEGPVSAASNLETIQRDLRKVLNHQVRARAEIRGFGEYQVMKDAKGNNQRRVEIMAQISKLIDANLEDDEIADNPPVAGS